MGSNIRRIETKFNKDFVAGMLHSDHVEIGEDNICMPSRYTECEEMFKNFQVRDDDVFLTGLPKTGTTWSQEMIWLILNNFDYEGAKEDVQKRVKIFEFPAVCDREKYNKFWLGDDPLTLMETDHSPRCIKTHMHWSLLPKQIQNGSKQPKIIHVLRNSQDTCVSHYHYLTLMNAYKGTLEQFCELYLTGKVAFGPFWKTVLSYWQQRHRSNLLYIRYKDMKDDLPTVIRNVAQFLGKTPTEEQVTKLAEHLSFKSMKNNPAVNHQAIVDLFMKGYDMAKDENCFIRRGEVGGYKTAMTTEMIDRFNECNQKYFAGTGLCIE